MAERPFLKFYDHVFDVLSNDAPLVALVPVVNIRPSQDVADPAKGNTIHYSWSASRWDKKRLRGEGTFNVSVGSAKNKTEALDILELVRELMTEKTLTDATPALVKVPLFSEQTALTDDDTDETGRYEAATQFDVKLIEV